MENAVQNWEERLEVAVSIAESELIGVSEVEIAQDMKAAPSPEWFAAFNAGFNKYKKTLKTSGILYKTK